MASPREALARLQSQDEDEEKSRERRVSDTSGPGVEAAQTCGNVREMSSSENPSSSPAPVPVVCSSLKEERKSKRRKSRGRLTVERDNLVSIFKLVTKEIIDSSLIHRRTLDDEFVPLQQLFTILEHVLAHNSKKSRLPLLRDNRDGWALLEQLQKFDEAAAEITTSVKEMSNTRSPLSKLRVWLRLALMQKKLADYFHIIINEKKLLNEYYDPGALMREDEATVVSGLMVGLNVINYALVVKDTDNFDYPVPPIDYSLYVSETAALTEDSIAHTEGLSVTNQADQLAAALDQNSYLEEHLKKLGCNVSSLKEKVEGLENSQVRLQTELSETHNKIASLHGENERLKTKDADRKMDLQRKLKTAAQDMVAERETYQTSREGLDKMYQESVIRLKEEIQLRLDVEKELEGEIGQKQESDLAVSLLERDMHEKQVSMTALRTQLEEVKGFNIEMYNKVQVAESALKAKTESSRKMDDRLNLLIKENKELTRKATQLQDDKVAAEETCQKLGQGLAEKDLTVSTLQMDMKIEREWRSTLQINFDKEKAAVAELGRTIEQYREMESKFERLQEEHEGLRAKFTEQESTLTEMGSMLSQSQLKNDDLRETQEALREAHWADDSQTTNCKQCSKIFNVARRKHHCRNCGDIFCNDCSDNKMPLPSSAKPVRVCDGCEAVLIQRYSAK